MERKEKTLNGFTLPELMVTAVIIILVFLGMLLGLIRCLELHELSRNSFLAVSAVKTKVEDIKNTALTDLVTTYNNVTFTTPDLNGIGVSYVDNTNPDLFKITVAFCWRQKNGRIVGEDQNLNGRVDGGEDANGNGILDSPVEIVSYIYNP